MAITPGLCYKTTSLNTQLTGPGGAESAPFGVVGLLKYRADIDELRAIAVLSVVLFHLELPGFDARRIRRLVPPLIATIAATFPCLLVWTALHFYKRSSHWLEEFGRFLTNIEQCQMRLDALFDPAMVYRLDMVLYAKKHPNLIQDLTYP